MIAGPNDPALHAASAGTRYDPETRRVRIRFLPYEWAEDPPEEGIPDDLVEETSCAIVPEMLRWRPAP